MPVEILMPALSPTMKDGVLAKWLKKEGDPVKSGDLIAEIETDKAIMEIEAVDAGTIGKILIQEGTSGVKVNTVIALLLEKGEDKSTIESYKINSASSEKETEKPIPCSGKKTQTEVKPSNDKSDRIFISPLAKRIAEQNSINIQNIQGSGPNGRIVKSDLENVKNKSESQNNTNICNSIGRNPVETYSVQNSTMRSIIAKRLQESKQEIPHFYLSVDCNVDELLKAREFINSSSPKDKEGKPCYKISVNDIVVKSVASALKLKNFMNCSWNCDSILYYNNIDISVAVSIQDGLITPIIKNVDQKGLIQISCEIKELAKKARENKLRPDEFQGGGITISNLGMYGIDSFKAIVNPPQACIISVGSVSEKPVVKNNQISIGNIMNVGISVDHRAIDGSKAAEFLSELRKILENPVLAIL